MILVVDDDPLIRFSVVETLRDEGYDVLAAPHGAAALNLLAQREQAGESRAKLIVLDMHMPTMDGSAFAIAYRQTPGPHAPIMAIGAAHDRLDWAEQIGADAVLPKPFDLDELLALVAQCLGRPGALRSQPGAG